MKTLPKVVIHHTKENHETLREMLLTITDKYLMTPVTIHNVECLRHEIYTFLKDKFEIVNTITDCHSFGYFFYYVFGNRQDGLYYIRGTVCNYGNGVSCRIEVDPDFNVYKRL